MREIKFRAWVKKNKKIVFISSITFSVLGDVYELEVCDEEKVIQENKLKLYKLKMGEFELIQFTGLKDKNGKEIYEGDIVKHNEEVWEIKYIFFSFVLRRTGHFMDYTDGDIEVIGNKFENPELLERKDNSFLQVGQDCKLCGVRGVCLKMLSKHRLGECIK